MNDKNSYAYQYGLKSKQLLKNKSIDPVLHPVLSKPNQGLGEELCALKNYNDKSSLESSFKDSKHFGKNVDQETFLLKKYAELSTFTGASVCQTYKRIEVMSLYSVEKTKKQGNDDDHKGHKDIKKDNVKDNIKDHNNENDDENSDENNNDSNIQQPESQEKEIQGSTLDLTKEVSKLKSKAGPSHRGLSLFGVRSKKTSEDTRPKTAIPKLSQHSSLLNHDSSLAILAQSSGRSSKEQGSEKKPRPTAVSPLKRNMNSKRLNIYKPLDSTTLERFDSNKEDVEENSLNDPKKDGTSEEILDNISKPNDRPGTSRERPKSPKLQVTVRDLLDNKSKPNQSRPTPFTRSKSDINQLKTEKRNQTVVPREKTLIENQVNFMKTPFRPTMVRSLIRGKSNTKKSDSEAQVFINDMEGRCFPIYTQTTLEDILSETKKETFNRQAQTVKHILISRELQTDFLRKRNIGMVFSGKKACKFTNTHCQANVLEHGTQINEHITFRDLICINWIDKNLFNVNVNPFKLVIDEKIRTASMSVCVSSDFCNEDMIL